MNSSGIMISNTKVPDELCDELINDLSFLLVAPLCTTSFDKIVLGFCSCTNSK